MYLVRYTQRDPEKEGIGRKFVRGMLRGTGVGLLAGSAALGAGMVSMKILGKPAMTLTGGRFGRIKKAAEELYPGTSAIPIHRNSLFASGVGMFMPKVLHEASRGSAASAGIHLPRAADAGFLAHELGHSVIQTRLEGKPLGVLRQRIRFLGGRTGASMGANLAPLATQMIGHIGIEKSRLSPDQKRKAHIGMAMVPAGFHAPILASEGGAWVRGLRILRKAGLSSPTATTRAVGAGGTYLLQAGAGVPGSLAFASGFRPLRKQPEQG